MNEILLQRSGRLLRITLNRPEQRNAIDRATDAALRAAWAAFAADDGLDVAILTGAGDDAFCAGADLHDYIPRFLNADMGVVRDNIATGLGGLTRGMPIQTGDRGGQWMGLGRRVRTRPGVRYSHCQHHRPLWQFRNPSWLPSR
ncbi:enoyl-CoA hydratase-related protein [Acidiphilium sp. MT5]